MPRWTFQALTVFSSHPSPDTDASREKNDKLTSIGAGPSTFQIMDARRPELEDGLATPPDLEDCGGTAQIQWLCKCEYQEIDFCPYCEYDQTVSISTSIVQTTPTSSEYYPAPTAPDTSNSRPSPRKLQKVRSNYRELRSETLGTAEHTAVKPDSIISVDSRTPLLNSHLRANSTYLSLPANRRTSHKLEKKRKRTGSVSLLDPHYPVSTKGLHSATIMSKSFLRPKVKETHGPRPKPISSSIETDALVSLAWTGQASSSIISPEVVSSSRTQSNIFPLNGSPPRSGFIQSGRATASRTVLGQPLLTSKRSVLQKSREPDSPTQTPNRPWTLAMAITDDEITDENLVKDLEEMRIKGVQSGPLALGLLPAHPYQTQLFDSYAEYPLQEGEASQEDIFPVDLSWTAARQVLLLCRELVRTERRYLISLKTLIRNGTSTPAPAHMLPYLPCLIMASKDLLARMEKNPSAQGVCEAFIACESMLRDAFISWCSVVGQFFDFGKRQKSRTEVEDAINLSSSFGNSKGQQRSQPITMRADTDLSAVIPEPNKIRKNTKLRPTVRDLAILPTQRIVRYVLLFKELHTLTPPILSSFGTVERALEAAESIAENANEAQIHVAFEQPP